jgi:hypothetical protein
LGLLNQEEKPAVDCAVSCCEGAWLGIEAGGRSVALLCELCWTDGVTVVEYHWVAEEETGGFA